MRVILAACSRMWLAQNLVAGRDQRILRRVKRPEHGPRDLLQARPSRWRTHNVRVAAPQIGSAPLGCRAPENEQCHPGVAIWPVSFSKHGRASYLLLVAPPP